MIEEIIEEQNLGKSLREWTKAKTMKGKDTGRVRGEK